MGEVAHGKRGNHRPGGLRALGRQAGTVDFFFYCVFFSTCSLYELNRAIARKLKHNEVLYVMRQVMDIVTLLFPSLRETNMWWCGVLGVLSFDFFFARIGIFQKFQ